METIPEATRKHINDYYSKSCDMSMSYFCRINKIKVYYLKRVLELYGQKLMPVLRDFSARSEAILSCESGESLVELRLSHFDININVDSRLIWDT